MDYLPAIFRSAFAVALIVGLVIKADAADNAAIFKTCIEKAEQLSKGISPPDKKDVALSRVALAYATFGAFEETERILERNPNPRTILDLNFSRMRAERPEIARRLISIAKDSVMRLSPAAARDGLLWQVAYKQALNGQIAEAFKTSELVETPSLKEQALYQISTAQSSNGDIDGALATAESIPPSRWRWKGDAFAFAAAAIARTGDWERARGVAEKSGGSYGSYESALYLMATFGTQGLDIEARIARALQVPQVNRVIALRRIGDDAARAGDLPGAKRAYRETYQAALRNSELPEIGGAQARAGFIEDALETAKVVEGNPGARRLNINGDSLVWLLGHIARAQHRIGQKEEARKTVASAEQVVSQDEYKNLSALLELVRIAGETGDIDLARRLAMLLPMPERFSFNIASAPSTPTRPDAWKIIAVQLAKTGGYDAAFKMIDEIGQTVGTDHTLAEIAVEQVRQDRLADALKTVDRINDAPAKVGALTEMALANIRPRPN